MDVLTTVDGAELGLLVAMRYLTVAIVIMRLRITSMLIKRRGIPSLAMRSNRLYAPFVAPSKRFSKCAPTVACAWPNTFAGHASFLMMIYPRDSFTVMVVASAESAGRRTFFTVTNVGAATQIL